MDQLGHEDNGKNLIEGTPLFSVIIGKKTGLVSVSQYFEILDFLMFKHSFLQNYKVASLLLTFYIPSAILSS